MIRSYGSNRCVRDAMDLCNISLSDLSSAFGYEEEKSQHMLSQEMIILAKMSWITKIFKIAYGDQAPHFSTLGEWEAFIQIEIMARGPEWWEEPPIIEGSSRYYHQQIKDIKRAGQKSNKDQQKEENNGIK